MRFHILGTGAIGCHIATELRARHPVTLLMRSQRHLEEFRALQNTITIRRLDRETPVQWKGFDAVTVGKESTPIETLVVATKAHHTVDAVAAISSQLNEKSTLVLLQNGMGVVDQLRQRLWGSSEAPTLIVGVNRHAVERVAPFSILHNSGWNDVDPFLLGVEPGSSEHQARPVLEAFQNLSKELQPKILPWPELRDRMLRKLVINASINPVAAMLEAKNSDILSSPQALDVVRKIALEANQVLDELNTTDDELVDIVIKMLEVASNNNCSMVQDVKAKRQTEIEFINGYLLKRAQEKGIELPVNQTMVNLIHAKEAQWRV